MNNDYTQAELQEIILAHDEWLSCAPTGVQANLSNKCLRGVNLSCATLQKANLCDVDLRNANLVNSDLRYSVLLDADLSGVDLSGADLRESDFYEATLRGADLTDVDLRGAHLCGANLYAVKGNVLVVGPLGSLNRFTYAYSHDNVVYVRCGCFEGTLDAFAARVKARHHGNEHEAAYNAAIEFIRTIAKLRWGVVHASAQQRIEDAGKA